MTTVSAPPEPAPSATARLSRWYYGLHPTVRLLLRWLLILASTAVAYHETFASLARTTNSDGIGGYVWTVPGAAALAAIGVARRPRNELPIHDRQTDIIVGSMGLVMAVLVQGVLLQRFGLYFHLLRLDLLSMYLYVLSASVILFGLRPVSRFAYVWGLLFYVFSLPYYVTVILLGGGKLAAGAATMVIGALGTGIAVGRTALRGFWGSVCAWLVAFAVLMGLWVLFPDAPLLVYQQVPVYSAIIVVCTVMFLRARRGVPKAFLERGVEPLAAKQVWAGVPVVVCTALILALVALPPEAQTSVVNREAPRELGFGQPLVAPEGWETTGRTNYRQARRMYGENTVLVRQEMTATDGDPRFDKFARPRTLMVDSIASNRPFTFDVYPGRVLYDLTAARLSPTREVDLGHGVTGQLLSVVDDKLLVTWNSLRFAWGDEHLAQRVSVFAVDNHEPGAPFPQPSQNLLLTIRTLFTMLLRGNAVLDQQAPTFKDAELLTEFGRRLVAAQFTPSGEAG
ncbi:hypothetical protein [Mycolicibacterium mengxianglii]|uniref:hypothetical protein n=1 Tax=Mycolicibacterium mengxianglii TaxID=2736649 RepID=UPI0018D1CA30|nr:hypothetical protein [Mycolicibacterium mengxianglii]